MNPRATLALDGEFPTPEAFAFHQNVPGYAESPLIDALSIAKTLGVGKVWVEDESNRFGLPAFSFGASWATYWALLKQIGGHIELWNTCDDLKDLVTV